MQIYLPIAELPVNVLLVLFMGLAVGFISGMFGIGGGFLMTPLLIFIGISPAVAVASVASHVAASSFSGAINYWRRRALDPALAAMLLIGGLIGTTAGARAAPDGYVMTLGNNQTHATNATLFEKQVSFDLLKDVQPVARLVSTRHVIVVPADSPYRTLKDLVKAGQTRPLNYASPSTGSAAHLVSESLRLQTGMQGTHIPYKGASPAVLAVIGGQVDFMTASYGSVTQFLQSGKLRALAISGKQREPSLPGVPTFAEEGYDALAADTWIALFAPANTPRTIVQQWSDALAKIMAQADIRQKLEAAGFDISYLPLAETEQFHRNEVPRWGKMVRAAGVTSE